MVVTGNISGDKHFMLQKYFLQILAGVKNSEIVMDPSGVLIYGKEQSVPFNLTEADYGIDVIVLTRYPQYIDFRLQTPIGFIIESQKTRPNIHYMTSTGLSYYRVVLPCRA